MRAFPVAPRPRHSMQPVRDAGLEAARLQRRQALRQMLQRRRRHLLGSYGGSRVAFSTFACGAPRFVILYPVGFYVKSILWPVLRSRTLFRTLLLNWKPPKK